jgi:tetratricopeptide (TPR) repeat protein
MVHFVTLTRGDIIAGSEPQGAPTSQTGRLVFWDPMGDPVDLAARLQSLAERDVVLVDATTFFRARGADEGSGICVTPLGEIQHVEVLPENERTTTYVPKLAVMSLEDDGIKTAHVGFGNSVANTGAIANALRQRTGTSEIVLAYAPVECNIRGVKTRVEAVALSYVPMEAPVKETPYSFGVSGETARLLLEAEGFWRAGKEGEAAQRYELVCSPDNDPRNFRANVRLSQYYRRSDEAKAKKHWTEAKHSDPMHPLTWAIAATTHFENGLEKDHRTEWDKAITDFARAKDLAGRTFDSWLEQYCSCLLAISYFVRNGAPDDLSKGTVVFEEIKAWSPLGPVTKILKEMASAFFCIAAGRQSEYDNAEKTLAGTGELLDKYVPKPPGGDPESRKADDILLKKSDLYTLLDLGRFRLDRAKRQSEEPAPIR